MLISVPDDCRCGPARHSIEAKRRGVTRAVGVDNQEVMLHYAKQLAGQAGADVELLQGSIGNLSKSLNLGAPQTCSSPHTAMLCSS